MAISFHKFKKKWWLYHLIFWIIVASQFCIDIIEYAKYDPKAYIFSILIRILLIAFLMYLNQFVLTPYLLQKKKYFFYILLLLTSLFLFSLVYKNVYLITTTAVAEVRVSPNAYALLLKAYVGIRFLIISWLFAVLQSWFEQERKLSQVQVDKLSTELKYLRAQINPHFLFNTLNNLYGLALIKSDKTPEVILKLSDIMDYMLYEGTEAKVSLEKDIENLENYIDLERIRQGNNAKIVFEVSGKTENKRIVPLLMLPILENAFKHGINKIPKNAWLYSKIIITNSYFEFQVENSKTGDENGLTENHGIGLINLNKRLNLFYENKHELYIKESPNQFFVRLKISF